MARTLTYRLLHADLRARMGRWLLDARRWLVHVWYTAWQVLWARLCGVGIGRGVALNGPVRFVRFPHSTIAIGDRCTLHATSLFNELCRSRCIVQTMTDHAVITMGDDSGASSVVIKAEEAVRIGRRVLVGAGTIIMDSDLHGDVLGTEAAPITIGDDVFIGMDCRILKGVTIGDGAVVAAMSVVTHDVPPGAVAAGVPARVVGQRRKA